MTTAPHRRQRLIVQKFGGMSLATPDHIKNAARRVAALRAQGFGVIAVVSAMAQTTDELIKLAYLVSPNPNRRELDMLLSTGERVSMALFSMALTDALHKAGLPAKAISFTGSQAGILTDDTHSNARIIDVKPLRVQNEIDRGNVTILAGFQGVSPISKEITTLGRGGTDVTAVAMAIAFNAERCEILKEVDGVLTADPRIVPSARLIETLTLEELAEMTFWGAKVLHYRSVELALTHNMPLHISLAHPINDNSTTSTKVYPADSQSKEKPVTQSVFEKESILSVNSHADIQRVVIASNSLTKAFEIFEDTLLSAQLPLPQVLEAHVVDQNVELLFTTTAEALEAQTRCLQKMGSIFTLPFCPVATVTATCRGAVSRRLIGQLSAALANKQIITHQVLVSSLSITFLIDRTQRDRAIETIHSFTCP